MIKPMLKMKTKRSQTVGFWSRKADKKFQEIGREMYEEKGCLICGGKYSCLHHVFTKASCTHLRYNWKNVIPICVGCHFKIHGSEPVNVKSLMDIVIDLKGEDWYEELKRERNKHLYTKAGYKYYENMFNNLSKITPYKV